MSGRSSAAYARAITRVTADGVEIRIPPARQAWALLMLPVWLGGWLPMGWSVATELALPDELADLVPFLFQLAWLAIWLAGSVAVLAVLLWSTFGVERASFTRERIALAQQLACFHWCRVFRTRDVTQLRAFHPPSFAVAGSSEAERCKLAFDHGGRTVAFASGIGESDAFRLLHEIRACAPWLDIR